MIIVTGANGQLGQAIVEHLIERVPAERIGVSVREPERAHTPGDPVRPVELVKEGLPRSQKVRGFDEECEGLVVWVPKVRLVGPWEEKEALLEDERGMFAVLKTSGARRVLLSRLALKSRKTGL
jgi:nucleoside-diphosphate-sugar epimerase